MGGAARAPLNHRCEVVEREGGRVEEALGEGASEPLEGRFVFAGLDSFGDDAYVEPARESEDRHRVDVVETLARDTG